MYTVITQEHYYKLLGVPISNFFGMGGRGTGKRVVHNFFVTATVNV